MTRSKQESNLPEIQRWAIREGSKVSPTAANVLGALLSYADLETGTCYPKRNTLSETLYDTNRPTKAQLNQISECLTRLVDAGLLERQQAFQNGRLTTNVYRLNIGLDAVTVPSVTRHCKPGNTGHRKPGSTGYREPGNTGHLEVSNELSNEVSTEERARGRHLRAVD